jgi:hypothetical protein
MKRNARSATVGQPAKSVRHAKARAHAGARKKPLITVEEG